MGDMGVMGYSYKYGIYIFFYALPSWGVGLTVGQTWTLQLTRGYSDGTRTTLLHNDYNYPLKLYRISAGLARYTRHHFTLGFIKVEGIYDQ